MLHIKEKRMTSLATIAPTHQQSSHGKATPSSKQKVEQCPSNKHDFTRTVQITKLQIPSKSTATSSNKKGFSTSMQESKAPGGKRARLLFPTFSTTARCSNPRSCHMEEGAPQAGKRVRSEKEEFPSPLFLLAAQ